MRHKPARPLAGALVAVTAVACLHAMSQDAAVSFDHVPPDVESVTVFDWREEAPPVRRGAPRVLHAGELVVVSGVPGARAVVRFGRSDGAYLTDGPFTWPERDERHTLGQEWRRTVQGPTAPGVAQPPLEWITADGRSDFWPRCIWPDPSSWSCWGVPVDAAGVVFGHAGGHVWWSAVGSRTSAAPALRISEWGRLLQARTGAADLPEGLSVKIARPVPPPAQRLRGIRLETAAVSAVRVTPVAEDALWLSGGQLPAGAWVEVRARGLGPTYLPAGTISEGPAALPYEVTLAAPLAVNGVTTGPADIPAAGALVTLFRLIDPPASPITAASGEPRPRRVTIAEVVTGSDGRFSFDDLADVDYEVLAWHGQYGRASIPVRGGDASLTVHLQAGASAQGRVLVHGRPAPGEPVVSMPDAQAFTAADDPTEVKGGDARSGPDGRFVVALAPSGGGELRIGGGAAGVRRIPLPKGPQSASIDLGDIELAASIPVTFMLDQDPGCDVVAVGPLGHTGLQVVTAKRTQATVFEAAFPEEGQYHVVLSCGTTERVVMPALVKVSAAETRTIINLRVR